MGILGDIYPVLGAGCCFCLFSLFLYLVDVSDFLSFYSGVRIMIPLADTRIYITLQLCMFLNFLTDKISNCSL